MASRHRTAVLDLAPSRAIVDIGSNTVRLVIYGGPARAPAVLHNEKVTARLGRNLAETGRLAEKGTRIALDALARYRVLLDLRKVPDIDVVATAAVRDASDGPAFLQKVRALGFAPRLLSGEAEALASAMGVIGAFPGERGVVADLGGGSLELIDFADGAGTHGVSLPLGTLRLGRLRAAGAAAFTRNVRAQLAATSWPAPTGSSLYLVGGSFRSIARFALQQGDWPSDDPHGFEMTAPAATELVRTLARRKPDALPPIAGIAASRLASLPDAAALLLALIEALRPERLVFSSWGLREGLLFAALEPGLRAQDPLLSGVSAFIRHHGASPAMAAMMAGWTAPANAAHADGTHERLRLAAAMLSLASANVEPNLRPDLAVDWAMRKRWIAISNRERTMLAAALMANTGRLDLPPLWNSFAPSDDLREAQAWGLAVRLCRRFSGCSPQSLGASKLTSDGTTLTLSVRRPYDVLVNDAVERDLKAVGTLLGLKTAHAVVKDAEAAVG